MKLLLQFHVFILQFHHVNRKGLWADIKFNKIEIENVIAVRFHWQYIRGTSWYEARIENTNKKTYHPKILK